MGKQLQSSVRQARGVARPRCACVDARVQVKCARAIMGPKEWEAVEVRDARARARFHANASGETARARRSSSSAFSPSRRHVNARRTSPTPCVSGACFRAPSRCVHHLVLSLPCSSLSLRSVLQLFNVTVGASGAAQAGLANVRLCHAERCAAVRRAGPGRDEGPGGSQCVAGCGKTLD